MSKNVIHNFHKRRLPRCRPGPGRPHGHYCQSRKLHGKEGASRSKDLSRHSLLENMPIVVVTKRGNDPIRRAHIWVFRRKGMHQGIHLLTYNIPRGGLDEDHTRAILICRGTYIV